MSTKRRFVELFATTIVALMIVGCDNWWEKNPENETSPDRHWVTCTSSGPYSGLWSYSPEPENGEIWEHPNGQFGTTAWFPYHFDTCVDIGESELSACIDGCDTLADMAASDGTMDLLWTAMIGYVNWHSGVVG